MLIKHSKACYKLASNDATDLTFDRECEMLRGR
jgi:hypothetical protein